MSKACHKARALLIVLLPLFSSAQSPTCSDIKNGVFIFFSHLDGHRSTYTRNGNDQKEVNSLTHQSVDYVVAWVSDCSYSLQYITGLEDRPAQEQEMARKHKFLVQILKVTDDYYTYQTSLDKATNPVIATDTLWIKQRRDAKNKLIAANPRIDSMMALKKGAFDSVMSKSAVLYVYRPGKFAESLVSYTIFLDDKPICEMGNKSAYIVRLLREGPNTFVAKLNKKEVSITIDVKNGEKYYLRCELPWSLAPKPLLTLSNKEEAQPFFDRIK
jgi:hypothetical protein